MRVSQEQIALDQVIVTSRGNHYIRYEESLQNIRHQGFSLGEDPFPSLSSKLCMADDSCLRGRRDADLNINIGKFSEFFKQALSLVA